MTGAEHDPKRDEDFAAALDQLAALGTNDPGNVLVLRLLMEEESDA